MDIKRVAGIKTDEGREIPALMVAPSPAGGGVVLCHGYGGAKEEMLGLAYYIAEAGLAALCPDMRGHGERQDLLELSVQKDLEACINYMRSYGKVGVVGHSMGGRLGLLSSADAVAAISSPAARQFPEEVKKMLTVLRSGQVKEKYPAYVLEILRDLPDIPANSKPKLLIYGDKETPGIIMGVKELSKNLSGSQLQEVPSMLGLEVEEEFFQKLLRWLNHMNMTQNHALYKIIPQWLKKNLV